jgi:hypothetical protein
MNSKLIIDFFATMGMPSNEMIKIIQKIKQDFGGDFSSDTAFSHVRSELMTFFSKHQQQMLIDFYPDCYS